MNHIRVNKWQQQNHRMGYILVIILVCASIGIVVMTALINWTVNDLIATREAYTREQSLQIAEAGIDYYRWHLAHAPLDFKDGTATSGPYRHDFKDKDGNVIGQFSLSIIPPLLGSTLVSITSVGSSTESASTKRTISVQLAKPSIAKYAVVANSIMRFGAGTDVNGPIHSNNGIRFDGVAHNLVTSAVASYNDPDHSGGSEFGVHTHSGVTDPLPPSAVPSRPDVFQIGRSFPVPSIDFNGMTSDLAKIKTSAQTTGFYRPGSGGLGYHVVLKTNDTFDLYKVTSTVNAPSNCSDVQGQNGWGIWSIQNQQLLNNYPIPANGLLFFEDHVYVDGQISSARLTIVAAFLPDSAPSRKNIIVNNDLLYTTYNGNDSIGLIAQGNILVGMVSDDDLQIDAALIAQNGFVGRYYYDNPSGFQTRCSPYHERQTLTLTGMIATNLRYGFAYTDGTGYQTRNIKYDANLLYAPPPSFPLTGNDYITLSWEEK